MDLPRFEDLAASTDPMLDRLALALAAALRPVDVEGALATLDALGEEVARALGGADRTPQAEASALTHVLGTRHGFHGDTEQYDRPENSLLDRVLERRRGLPILLSTVYVEVARRAGVPLAGVGLPGHYVVGHFGGAEPLLLDPFAGGLPLAGDVPWAFVRPWTPQQTAMRMLNNLVPAFQRRGDLTRALRAAELRLALPAGEDELARVRAELVALRAGLN
ncbi:transglutaminase-like domain-containing protein [Solirubrobacter pauli]|nr:transglutaminase-like domain-containing protein [Solirubrobacter pauli]